MSEISIKPWVPRFLEGLRKLGTVQAACRAASTSRTAAYNLRSKDPAFAEAWADTIEDSIDELYNVARERALKRSDALLMRLLKAACPEVYGEPRGGTRVVATIIIEPKPPARETTEEGGSPGCRIERTYTLSEISIKHPWVPRFLEGLGKLSTVRDACRAARMSRTAAYNLRNNCPAFAEAWTDAKEDGIDRLLEVARESSQTIRRPIDVFIESRASGSLPAT